MNMQYALLQKMIRWKFIMRKCSVEVEEEWSSAKGKMLKYIFSSLKPKTGKMIEKYKKAESLDVG